MKKYFIIIALVLTSTFLNAQVKGGVHSKLAKFYANEQWEDCAFKADRMILKTKYQNNAEVYLYLAASYNKIFLLGLEDTTIIYKVPDYVNAYKYALKYSVLAQKKDKKAKFYFPKNDFMLEEIAIAGMHYIDHYISIKRIPKANSQIRRIMKSYKDINIYFLHGVLSAASLDPNTAKTVITEVFEQMDTDRPKNVTNTEFIMIDAFDLYANYLMNLEKPLVDSAKNILNKGLRYFPGEELFIYNLQKIENPELDIPKPENKRKTTVMKQISVIGDNDDDDDEEEEEED